MEEIYIFIKNYYNDIIIVLLISILLLLILSIINSIRFSKLKGKYYKLIDKNENVNLEKVIIDYYDKVNNIMDKSKNLESQMKMLEGKIQLCTQKIGVIRYNAFENVGSNLSFAIAVLDLNDNGFIINGIYSRESSATYAKPIINGSSKYALSVEEMQALDLAKKNYNERDFIVP